MKEIRIYVIILSVLIATFSCVDDDITGGTNNNNDSGSGENIEVNEWIYDKMSDNYLWYEEIPSKSRLNFDNDPETFFYSLLSSKDGKSQPYSYIKENTDTRSYQGDSPSFGFEYTAWQLDRNSNLVGIQILYVLPDSPADKQKLKRGQWIFTLNDETITTKNYTQIATSSQITIGVAENLASMSGPLKTYTLAKATVKDHPVFISEIIEDTKIAYLMYNHFTTGPGGTTDSSFDKDLENAIKSLVSEGAEEFILDLRYNGGGYVSSAQVLASALVPANYLKEEFCKLTYNDKQKKQDQTYKFINSYHSGLNLERLFVICSSRTASASELVIAGLQPYIDNIIIVGETTEGKNVGSLEYKDSNYDWILHPIVCHVTNTAELDYSEGFNPTSGFSYSYNDELYNEFLYDLGDPEEAILKGVIGFIENNQYPDWKGTRSVSSPQLTVLGSSLDRKTKNGVLLNE